ncbi:MAG TPA: ester cyclase [Acetobacteraceae bacterium]|jgi:predicted ester cyclase|nr:ester cyclase [Acetobacteraceae bacterium]HTB42012.1 ester cyclase [Acetobacteraceae bacterium]
MNPLGRTLTGAAVSLLTTIALVHSGGAADQSAANGALLRQYFADINAHDVASLKDVIAENYVQRDTGQGTGLAGMQAAYQRYFAMFPDFRMTLEDSVITGDKIVARFQITATHDHPVQLGANAPVFPPTGKQLAWEGISIWRVANGKFVEHWGVDDLLGAAQQMRSQPPGQGK